MTFESRDDYICQTFAQETPALRALRETLDKSGENISIHPQDGRLLQFLIGIAKVRTIVEIGTFGGYSTLWMANALLTGGKIHTLEKDPLRAAAAKKTFANNSKVNVIEGDALQSLAALSGPVDMVFIDADKLNYLHYLDWAEKNLRVGGLIVGDNTFLFDAVWKDEEIDRVRETARNAMRVFNRRLADPVRYDAVMLDTVEGMTIARKKI